MPEQKGIAGASVREMASKRHKNAIWIAVGGIAGLIILFLILHNSKLLGLGGGAILVLLFLVRIMPGWIEQLTNKKLKEEKRAIRGAVGEERVADLLSALGPDYLVIHDIPSPYGNIDHIVIGRKTGLFLLETKAHGGKVQLLQDGVLVNGKPTEKNFIAQCLKNTYWLRDEVEKAAGLKPWITPILVFTNAFVPFGKPIKGVVVTNKRYLIEKLQTPSEKNSQLVWEKRLDLFDSLMNQKSASTH